eukprot:CAMPEP_0114429646 /NCGR_PEP_ID=MMETSP0103-20121206/9604_1 /TAXON_ID=37642 ORGANISM="Paraphysomonas imperforata, Strain PA2" /NCGR_SAMPLE_ID=MMETSP0103 /ASSEMBLY_ACC=CAM_ASM_000201 /LENGTH=337 /DNA_ID=CAMNT_0001599011 /DNA_START=59 /DNA_END=1072 /DNA_ORIENTATION=-
MKAIQYTENTSSYDDLHTVDVERPTSSPGIAVVKVMVSSANPIDFKVMQGHLKAAGWAMPFPFTIGYDFAGIVESVDEADASSFAVGDEVFAVNWGQHKHDEGDLPVGGAFAEFIRIPTSKLSKKPPGVSFEEAAAVALVGTTAYQILFDCAQVKEGSKVLILGGASAVGALAVQLAKARGAWVATTCSSRTMEYTSQFGADKIINYRETKWEDDSELKNIDAVVDTVGEAGAFGKSKDNGVVAEGGVFVSIASFDAGIDPSAHAPRLSFGAFYCLKNSPAVQDELAGMIANGKLKVCIDKSFPFNGGEGDAQASGARELLAYQEGGTSCGKNLLTF